MQRSMTARLLLVGALLWAACGATLAASASGDALRIASVQSERDLVRVELANPGEKSASALLIVTVLCNGKPVRRAVPVEVKGEGTATTSVQFDGAVTGVLSTGLVDAAEPQ